MEDWLTGWKIPLGKWIDAVVKGFSEVFRDPINAFSIAVKETIEATVDAIQWCPPLLVIAAIAALAWYLQRSWVLVVGTVLSLTLVVNLGYWDETAGTLALILYATGLSMLIGVPIGIAAAHRPWLWTALRPVLDLMQTIPTFVYLIPALVLFGLGFVPGLVATLIFAIPAPIRLTYLGISAVPKPLIEAGEAFGATRRQLLYKVEIPQALPTIMAGVTQCIMLSLSMVVIAALVGAPGLGVPVVRALNSNNGPLGYESGLAIVIIAILLDRICRQRRRGSAE
jgi:glycine betaine/proline transport system permease protein